MEKKFEDTIKQLICLEEITSEREKIYFETFKYFLNFYRIQVYPGLNLMQLATSFALVSQGLNLAMI